VYTFHIKKNVPATMSTMPIALYNVIFSCKIKRQNNNVNTGYVFVNPMTVPVGTRCIAFCNANCAKMLIRYAPKAHVKACHVMCTCTPLRVATKYNVGSTSAPHRPIMRLDVIGLLPSPAFRTKIGQTAHNPVVEAIINASVSFITISLS